MSDKRELLEATEKALPALRAICHVAASNFPTETFITISCNGNKGQGSIVIPHYVLLDLLPHE